MVLAFLDRDRNAGQGAGITPSAVRVMLTVEYEGTRYAGSQRQKNGLTVQAELEQAIAQLTGKTVNVSLAGRTDAGVHARGQVACFMDATGLPVRAFMHGLNHYLPADIAVKSAAIVPEDFDPRRSASRREYEYCILTGTARSPLWAYRAFLLPGCLDVDLMKDAAALLTGEHDFASFATGLTIGQSTIRRMYEVSVRRDGGLVAIKMIANAFLPHQVRNTVGAMIQVGQGRMPVAGFGDILTACQPALAQPTAPACGLYLNKVYYDKYFEERINEDI
jgi:tRNA pseudouridine38-40 synthase